MLKKGTSISSSAVIFRALLHENMHYSAASITVYYFNALRARARCDRSIFVYHVMPRVRNNWDLRLDFLLKGPVCPNLSLVSILQNLCDGCTCLKLFALSDPARESSRSACQGRQCYELPPRSRRGQIREENPLRPTARIRPGGIWSREAAGWLWALQQRERSGHSPAFCP